MERYTGNPILARLAPGHAFALLAIGSGAGLTACTGQKLTKLATCDGKHLRTGNPNGSVLPGAPIPATTAPAGPGSPTSGGASRPVTGSKTTSASDAVRYPSC